ncbi:MFS transporter [Companilactobacillus sp.]|jgi:MFS family permease|uniref:MFS transporter n=1 Tax=Companilactobacillus sp. TaxID=2767905 RepID=UPI0025C6BE08|nr:MFS transporter [Companilactobacillus sp.]MCH4009166.1 MFS transporter [Companilactobacillus sp.]MCH4050655.1 MFS transporter [Companilactobacillus sp.]MCH4077108.1 MFS transporter [Companilactobacillus sp.]MCH4125684.1 MFS transporter [Companilactobacillus sp.]MCI1311393.1 MFS transporter [Companilactobacillus sp.]
MVNSQKKYYPTAFALYFAYFILGIALSIMGQFKPEFAQAWGATRLPSGAIDESMVVSVIAAYGLGRLIAYPFAGPVSDKIGRRVSGFIGIALYAIFFFGIINVHSMWIAYGMGVLNGVANSFLDTCISPSVMEIFPKSASIANLFTKFAITIAQFLLPFAIGLVASAHMSYKVIFIFCGVVMVIDAILILILPFPQQNVVNVQDDTKKAKQSKIHFSGAAIASILIGFTSSTTFMIWLNCNQELGKSYGISDPSVLQSFYAVGATIAVLLTAQLIHKGIKETTILILYPSISVVMLLLCYLIESPFILYVGSFVIGYAAAGGVLQLATSTTISFFPSNKGLATSLVMIASAIANYAVLSTAAYLTKVTGTDAPRMIIILNVIITIIGIGLAIIVKRHKSEPAVVASPEN